MEPFTENQAPITEILFAFIRLLAYNLYNFLARLGLAAAGLFAFYGIFVFNNRTTRGKK